MQGRCCGLPYRSGWLDPVGLPFFILRHARSRLCAAGAGVAGRGSLSSRVKRSGTLDDRGGLRSMPTIYPKGRRKPGRHGERLCAAVCGGRSSFCRSIRSGFPSSSTVCRSILSGRAMIRLAVDRLSHGFCAPLCASLTAYRLFQVSYPMPCLSRACAAFLWALRYCAEKPRRLARFLPVSICNAVGPALSILRLLPFGLLCRSLVRAVGSPFPSPDP